MNLIILLFALTILISYLCCLNINGHIYYFCFSILRSFYNITIFINMGRNKEQRKQYLEENKDIIKIKKQEYYLANKEKISQYQKDWQKNNKDKIRANQNKRSAQDPLFRLKNSMKQMVYASLKNKGIVKHSRTEELLGCTYQEFKIHLETLFQPWMTWANYGKYNGTECYGWDIDHIIPLSSAKTSIDLSKLNHYTNLQPLCSYINRDVKRDII